MHQAWHIRGKRRDLDNRIADIVCATTTCDETLAVLKKIANARDQLFIFLDAPDLVEPTNNACERALRPAVINRKVTNGFRAQWAAEAYAAVRTVVDTARLAPIPTPPSARQSPLHQCPNGGNYA